MATHSRILAWEIPWTEEPGGDPWDHKRGEHDLAAKQQQQIVIGIRVNIYIFYHRFSID